MPETMKVLGSTKRMINNENGENVPDLEITEVVLVHCAFHAKILFFKKIFIQNFDMLKYGLLIKILNH